MDMFWIGLAVFGGLLVGRCTAKRKINYLSIEQVTGHGWRIHSPDGYVTVIMDMYDVIAWLDNYMHFWSLRFSDPEMFKHVERAEWLMAHGGRSEVYKYVEEHNLENWKVCGYCKRMAPFAGGFCMFCGWHEDVEFEYEEDDNGD